MSIVGVDIGGTFTDLVGCIDGRIVTSKTSTTPADPTRGVADSMRQGWLPRRCARRSAARRDDRHQHRARAQRCCHRARHHQGLPRCLRDRPRQPDRGIQSRFPSTRSRWCRASHARGRRARRGRRQRAAAAATETTIATAGRRSSGALDVDAVAVCLLHAWANPDHERALGAAIRRAFPAKFVTLGPRDPARIARVRAHLDDRAQCLRRAAREPLSRHARRLPARRAVRRQVHIMRSNGGVMSLAHARAEPVSMMESGPVAGMIGAGRLARHLGIDRAIGFDMGGTTAKSSLITDGEAPIEDGYVIGDPASGQPMQLPVVDIVEVGAGGGSIAWIDEAGGLHVGPKSAGADPGPACLRPRAIRPLPSSPTPTSCSGASMRGGSLAAACASTWRQPDRRSRPDRASRSDCRSRKPRSASRPSPTTPCRCRCARCPSTRASIPAIPR